MYIRHIKKKLCPKCKKEEVFNHESDLLCPYSEEELPEVLDPDVYYVHVDSWFRCHSCNWERYYTDSEDDGKYYKKLEYEDIKVNPLSYFHEKKHNWKWMPISKREAEEDEDFKKYRH